MSIFNLFSKKTTTDNQTPKRQSLPVASEPHSIAESLLIPEPTKSLLWTTDEDTAKIERATSINLVVDGDGFHIKENGFYSEPSLIWTNLPIEPNDELIQDAMYWPSYSSFSPKARYQYLRWLKDITQPTNLSYVFLYFYGLERHLLVGEYDAAVDEIARLLRAHQKSSFASYASQSLIVASLAKERLDITDRVPSLLEEEIDEALALRVVKGTSMTPEDVIGISSKVGFKNKRYIKLYPEQFAEELQRHIDEFEDQFGNILSTFKLEDFKQANATVFANLSIPEHIRHVSVPIILEDKKFSKGMYNLLQAAHDNVKTRVASGDIDRKASPSPAQPRVLNSGQAISDREIDDLIKNTEYDGGILDLHFALQERIQYHYSKRQVDDNYHKSIAYCRAQIKIQDAAAKAFLREYPWDKTLPSHVGYRQLAIILEKEKKFNDAVTLVDQAKVGGWNGDWDSRMKRLRSKTK